MSLMKRKTRTEEEEESEGQLSFTATTSCKRVVCLIERVNGQANNTIDNNSSNRSSFSPSCLDDRELSSCCSSNGSNGEHEATIQHVDLQDESSQEDEGSTCNSLETDRETVTLSSEMDSTANQTTTDNNTNNETEIRQKAPAVKMPTQEEIDEFFEEAEKKILKTFTEKYNFDFENEKPLEGRYEWVKMKP